MRARVVVGLMGVALACALLPLQAAQAKQTGGQPLYPGAASYPRVIRLEHNGAANGRILASASTIENGDGAGIIFESTNGGATFAQVGRIDDPEGAGGRGLCCASLYELPRAVGDMPAGTLLWADSAGYLVKPAQRHTKQRLWVSRDLGRTWTFRSDIATSANKYNMWEPELTVARDGQLVALWADESDKPAHDQTIVQARSRDGVTWTDKKTTVQNSTFSVRPGMPGVRLLPNGTYFMVYEVCNLKGEPLCTAYFRTSRDGWNYGDPNNLGTGIRTADGKYPRHTPTVSIGARGRIVLATEMLVNADGSHAPGNGKTLLVNGNAGRGPWREVPAPVQVADPNNEVCSNFSPTVLASGNSVLHITTDTVDGVCKAFYATGPIAPAR